jgi:hypothetical protein
VTCLARRLRRLNTSIGCRPAVSDEVVNVGLPPDKPAGEVLEAKFESPEYAAVMLSVPKANGCIFSGCLNGGRTLISDTRRSKAKVRMRCSNVGDDSAELSFRSFVLLRGRKYSRTAQLLVGRVLPTRYLLSPTACETSEYK